MAEVFAARWVKCLDKSMSIWTNRWTCPGWVFRPRKPWPFGNEYHSACCALCGLMFSIELVEGKDRPAQLRNQKYDAYGKTAGLLLRMLETYFASGRYAVLDSGFCVLKAILALMTVGGLFAGALIKKRRYWPLLVPGPAMDDRFATKAVGEVEAIQGFDVASNTPYFFWCMKESDYVMRIMATGGSLITDDTCKIAHRGVGANRVSFPYMKPYDWHFRYRHSVDDHNNLHHSLPSIEGSWTTDQWALCVFQFLLAISEVNCYLAFKYFVWDETVPTLVEFRRYLAWALINNPLISAVDEEDFEPETFNEGVHDIATAPNHASGYRNRSWVCEAQQRHQQYHCKWQGCSVRTRNYCTCTPGYWLCPSHIVKHAMMEVRKEFLGN
ncbi:hypothetical protein ACHAWO_013675 [Cyclotella atomus]|uniref:PiggyBac transposable element-derived protein domain-containing protein n=1 Tax=Cyclotella atomus TaxID=382360 RepID=A0ABD3Q0F8_9STRA